MPIGKNSIKRVANSGYSNIDSKAPDMENSVVNEPKEATAKAESKKKTAAPKSTGSTPKKTACTSKKKPSESSAKKSESPKPTSASPANPTDENTAKKDGAIRLGDDMPAYLL